ncbi:hypothetical protein Q4561_19610 [Alteromonas sp. 1_MG-2023]|uniref:hypothetical protein n=1 Tax=Alteromonas sp. 1_MG-2023 TaxID=3062669 RepID=UPI0026E1E1BF|nr:hypothetical protein [Alteromonas sp. 1_MG-2023]MDO6569278.1 hypothetical protein [Alteromonas sp. 1_MG-2023]
MRYILLFGLILSFQCIPEDINPLIGHWKPDLNRSLASTEKGSKAYHCFKIKLCGSTDMIFSETELTSISYTGKGAELMRDSEPYEITSYIGNQISIYFPNKESSFIYHLKSEILYYSSEKHGFTEFFVLQK